MGACKKAAQLFRSWFRRRVFKKAAKERNTTHPFSAGSAGDRGSLGTLLPARSHPAGEVCQHPSGGL